MGRHIVQQPVEGPETFPEVEKRRLQAENEVIKKENSTLKKEKVALEKSINSLGGKVKLADIAQSIIQGMMANRGNIGTHYGELAKEAVTYAKALAMELRKQ